MEPSALAAGEILAGKYRAQRLLGEGGMGQVIAAEHIELGHRVALKVLRPHAMHSSEAIERFVREARAAARLQSEHIAHVSDVGKLDNGLPYMVMELLEGRDFAAVLADGGEIRIHDAVDWILQACEGVAEAHRHGIIHRDLKPANLFLTRSSDGPGLVKVLDFGVSKRMEAILGDEVPAITTSTTIIGSPRYMSPEQMQGSRLLDSRADIWALGTILYEMLAGRRAFEGATLATTCAQILKEAPRTIRSTRPKVPEALEAVVLRCLQKDPARRFSSVGELATALAPFAPDRQALVSQIVRKSAESGALLQSSPGLSEAAGVPSIATPAPWRPAEDSAAPGAAGRAWRGRTLVAVAAIGVVAALAWRGRERGADPQPAPATISTAPTTTPAPTMTTTSTTPVASSAPTTTAAPPPSAAPVPSARPPARAKPLPRPAAPPTDPGLNDRVLQDRR